MKKVLITGAGSGLGRGTAIGLAQAGHWVIATTQIWPQVTELRRRVAELGLDDRVTVDKLDVLDHRDIAAAAAWDFDTFVSNAAIGDSGPMAEIPVDLVRRTFETNVFSNLNLTQHVIRKWVDAGTRGRIVIVSSMGGLLTAYGLGTYCATKHALEAIAATLRDELASTGITVQTINPGPYDTGFNDRIADTTYRWCLRLKTARPHRHYGHRMRPADRVRRPGELLQVLPRTRRPRPRRIRGKIPSASESLGDAGFRYAKGVRWI